MIEDGRITYAGAQSPLLSAEFSSVTLTAIAIAALTTLLSYQATGLIFDLLLGIKLRGVALIRNVHILLLSRQSSIIAVLDAVLRWDWITRLRLRLPRGSFVSRDEEKIRPLASFKLLILLIVAPLFNILSIAMTLESNETLTFAQAGFGGLVLDFNLDLSVMDTEPFVESCSRAKLASTTSVVSVAKFTVCHWFEEWISENAEPGKSPNAVIDVSVIRETAFTVYVVVNEWWTSTSSRASVETLDGAVVVKPGVNLEAQRKLAMQGIELVAKECGLSDASEAEEMKTYKEGGVERRVAFTIPCPNAKTPLESAVRVNQAIGPLSTLVNSKRFDVLNASVSHLDENNTFFDAGNERFITRRTRYVSLPLLAIATGVMLVLRVLVKIMCNNDVRDGLEKIVKDRLRVGKNQSLIRGGKRKIYYDTAHCAGKERVEVIQTDGIVVRD